MMAALAILLKDLRVFLDSWRAIALVLLLPAVLVLFESGKSARLPTRFRVLLAIADEDAGAQAAAMASMLGESSEFEVQVLKGPVLDPLQAVHEQQVDLLCVFENTPAVRAYSGVTDRSGRRCCYGPSTTSGPHTRRLPSGRRIGSQL